MDELEREAKGRYCDLVEWKYILEALPDEKQEEWKRLYKAMYGKEY